MATTFNPIDQFSTSNTASATPKNYWDMPKANTGSNSVAGFDFPDFSSLFSNYRNSGQNMLSGQDQQAGQFLSNYSGAIGNQEAVPAMYTRLSSELGLPNLQRNANQLNETIAAIPETYGDATRGFDVNANQLSRIIGTKTAQLQPEANRANTAAQNAASQVLNLMGLTQQQQAKELSPYEYERQFLTDRIARETSLFTTQSEQELNALLQKMQTGATLTNAEAERKNQLEMQKQSYENSKRLAEQQFGYNQQLQSPTSTNSGDWFYDPFSGWVPVVD